MMVNLGRSVINITDTDSDTEGLLTLQNGSDQDSTSDIVQLDTDNLSDIIVSEITGKTSL